MAVGQIWQLADGARYGELLRSERWRGFRCETCNTESCELCVASEELGKKVSTKTV